MEQNTPSTPSTSTPNPTPVTSSHTHAIDPVLRQSIFVSVAILLAGTLVAGAILYNGSKNPQPTAGAQPTAAATKPADISKVKTEGEPFIGKVDAPVTVAYWTDYQCPFCQRNEQQVISQIVTNYVDTGKVKIVFKDYAFLGVDSQTIGKYARAVWETVPDKFYAWHKNMFDNQGQENTGWATKEKLHTLTAATLGEATTIKIENLVATKGAEYQKEIDADKTEGTAMGIQGTPGSIIGKQLIPGAYPYDTFKSAIETALKNN